MPGRSSARSTDGPGRQARATSSCCHRPGHPLPDWRIGCTYTRAGFRRQGVAAAALRGAVRFIAEAGGGRVEGYPEPVVSVPAGFLFHGALSTFDQAGFVRDRMIGKHRWVVTATVAPTDGLEALHTS